MANYRRGRINDEVQKALSEILREVKDPRVSSDEKGNMVSIEAYAILILRDIFDFIIFTTCY